MGLGSVKKNELLVIAITVVLILDLALAVNYFFKKQSAADSGEMLENPNVRAPLTLGLVMKPANALVILSVEKNFIPSNIVDYNVKIYHSEEAALEGLFSGEADMVTASETSVAFNRFKRQDFSIIASIGSIINEVKIVAHRGHGVSTTADLWGQQVGTLKGSPTHYFLHLFLEKNGMTDHVKVITFKEPKDILAAMSSGEIVAASMREPHISEAVEFFGENVVTFTEHQLYSSIENIVIMNSQAANRSGVVNVLLKAVLQAETFAADYPGDAIRIIARKLGLYQSQLDVIWSDLELKVSLDRKVLDMLTKEARWAQVAGLSDSTAIPDFAGCFYVDSLKALKPEAVTLK